jgi:hypothetical protein
MVAQKFVEQVQTIAAAGVELKSPLSPFFKGGISAGGVNPSLTKRRRRDLCVACGGNYVANFRDSTLAEKLFQ